MDAVTAVQWSFIDLVLVVGLLLSMIVGIWRGFVKEVMALMGWVVAYFMAQWFGAQAGFYIPVGEPGSPMNMAAGMLVVFIGAWLGWAVVTWAVTQVIKESGLGSTDRALGAVFGLMRGVVVALVLLTVVRATPLADSEVMQTSMGVHALDYLYEGLRPMLPEQVVEYLPSQF